MTEAGHILTAKSRIRSVHARLIFSAFNFLIAFYLVPSLWLCAWLVIAVVAQLVERQIFINALAGSRRGAFTRHKGRLIASVAAVAAIFDFIVVYEWVYGGSVGKLIAMLAIVCTLMHALFTLSYKRQYMLAAFLPHALVLLALPAYSLFYEQTRSPMAMGIVLIMILIMVAYILRGGRSLHKTLMAQHAARESAHKARRLAEQALNTKFNFLATVSHEIRTPMNAVVSSVHLLRQTGLSKAQSDYLNLLDQASEVLLGLLNDVLDLSKIEAGKMKIEETPVNLADMFEALNTMWLPQARVKGLELAIDIDPNAAPLILSDALRLKQILFNLLSNAVKFTHKGTICIRFRLGMQDGLPVCHFVVEDEGVGIAPDKLETIFLGFEQADASTTRRYGGSGLGLTISQRFARLMGGDLTVTSTPGVGSCFTLSLPYRPASAAVIPVVEKAPEVLADPENNIRRHVLIVDDHEVNRRLVSLFIAPLQWTWSMAADGEEAIDICARETFDLILMDMQMPRLNGIDASRAIRATPGPNQHTPIIALTANGADMHIEAWSDAGVEEVITKPVRPESLISKLQAYIRDSETTDNSQNDETSSPHENRSIS